MLVSAIQFIDMSLIYLWIQTALHLYSKYFSISHNSWPKCLKTLQNMICLMCLMTFSDDVLVLKGPEFSKFADGIYLEHLTLTMANKGNV